MPAEIEGHAWWASLLKPTACAWLWASQRAWPRRVWVFKEDDPTARAARLVFIFFTPGLPN